MSLFHFYRRPALSPAKKNELLSLAKQSVSSSIEDIETEYCFNIETRSPLSDVERNILRWLLSETFEPENFAEESFLSTHTQPPLAKGGNGGVVPHPLIIEVGPRMNFTTAWSTNAVSICHACGLTNISRIERSKRYKLLFTPSSSFVLHFSSFTDLVHDRMTEFAYPDRLNNF